MNKMSDLKPLGKGKKGKQHLLFKKGRWLLLCLAILVFALGWVSQVSDTPVISYMLGKQESLKMENGRVNVLLLGIAGGNHDGPNLTDTIMVASYDPKSERVDLISLPRDLWVDGQKAKVNTLYQTGISRGEGLKFTREEIGQILGITIPYAVRIDFAGFVKAVDLVEGVDVEIPRTFDDYQYPAEGKQNDTCEYQETLVEIDDETAKTFGVKGGRLKALLDPNGNIATIAAEPNRDIIYSDEGVLKFFHCRFEHLSFKQGLTKMDGSTALKFVRSRQGTNNEGSDFARSKRQQLVLQSFKDKVLSAETLLDPRKVVELGKTFGQSIESDILQSDYVEFLKIAKNIKEVKSVVIDTNGDDPLLITPRPGEYGAWVLIPAGNDFTKIHRFVDAALTGSPVASASSQKR